METLNVVRLASSQMSDSAIIQGIINGEKELFEILLRRYNQTLFRTIRSYLKDEDLVRDTMQETYLKAFKKLDQFQGKSSFQTWLIRIGINESLLVLRKSKKNKSRLAEINKQEGNIFEHSGTNNMNPEKIIIQKETRNLIEAAVDQLPERYRVVYILRAVEGMDNEKIAECLGLSNSNVKVRFHRAKSMLEKILYELSADKNIFEFGNEKCDRMVENVMKKILG